VGQRLRIFEYDAHVPFCISAPGVKGGQRTDALVGLVDLFPTLVELCALPAPQALDGSSLVPTLRDPAQRVDEAAFTQHPRPRLLRS